MVVQRTEGFVTTGAMTEWFCHSYQSSVIFIAMNIQKLLATLWVVLPRMYWSLKQKALENHTFEALTKSSKIFDIQEEQ